MRLDPMGLYALTAAGTWLHQAQFPPVLPAYLCHGTVGHNERSPRGNVRARRPVDVGLLLYFSLPLPS